MNQLPLSFDAPRERGEAAGRACTEKAERVSTFNSGAAAGFVTTYLFMFGASWGEDIVDAAKATGRPELACHDGRAWGSVFAGLAKRGVIQCIRADGIRRRGNGTSGARLWDVVAEKVAA